MSPRIDEGFVRVEDKIYSVEKLSKFHPGGPVFVNAFSGRDASQAFMSYHRRQFPHSRAAEAFEKTDETVNYTTKDNEDFFDLCERVNKVLPRLKSFAPWHFYLKAFIILGSAFSLEFYIHYTSSYVWYLLAPLGFLFALIGMNVQHDANHGAISRHSWVNRLFGMSQNWIGGSTVSWIHQHVVQHHIHTNDIHLDPDIGIEFYLRLNPRHPILKFHFFQYIYFFIIASLFGMQKVLTSITDVFTWFHYTPMSKGMKPLAWTEWTFTAIYMTRWIILPILLSPPGQYIQSFSSIFVMLVVMGYYLSFFFTISHNFSGVQKHEETSRETNANKSFLYNQVASSSNVAGFWLAILNGGLNYQIEHHLFPRINHTYYHKIAPVVRQFCLEKNIPYTHFPTLSQNVEALIQHLFVLGKSENDVDNPFNDESAKSTARMPLIS